MHDPCMFLPIVHTWQNVFFVLQMITIQQSSNMLLLILVFLYNWNSTSKSYSKYQLLFFKSLCVVCNLLNEITIHQSSGAPQ